jgi:hypothetical protein
LSRLEKELELHKICTKPDLLSGPAPRAATLRPAQMAGAKAPILQNFRLLVTEISRHIQQRDRVDPKDKLDENFEILPKKL